MPSEVSPPARASPLGAGYLVLVVRELTGLSQRRLAKLLGTTQPWLARVETGGRMPNVRTLLRVAGAAGLELVLGLRRAHAPPPEAHALDDFSLIGTLRSDTTDGLADFVVFREPSVFQGPR